MVSLREWAYSLLDRLSADLPPDAVAHKRRLLDMGEQALVSQDLIVHGLERRCLSRADLETARAFASLGVFGRVTPWFVEQIEQELARTAA